MTTTVGPALGTALRAGREQFNGLAVEARLLGGGFAEEAFTDALRGPVDALAEAVDLEGLSELLRADHEDVVVKAALAISALCARDEELQASLASAGGLPRIVALFDGDYSPRSVLDLTLCLKALTGNRMHHPQLLTQFVQARAHRGC